MDEHLLYYIRKAYEPYMNVIPGTVEPYMRAMIEKVEGSKPGFHWAIGKGLGCCIPMLSMDQKEPKVGDTIELFGAFGRVIDGIRLNGDVIFWRDKEYSEMHARRNREDLDAERVRHKATFKPDLMGLLPFKIKNGAEEDWSKHVQANCSDGYSFAVVRYAARWAHYVEKLGTASPENFKTAARTADDEGITGAMYGVAVSVLSQVWEHGEELRLWHNLDTQTGNEGKLANASGGVLNPAMFSVGAKQ